MSRLSTLYVVLAVSLVGSLLAVAVPTFLQHFRASKLAEPIEGLQAISGRAVSVGLGRTPAWAFPEPVGLTPGEVPRGVARRDPPEIWQHPTWRELRFKPEAAHSFAFAFDSRNDPQLATFEARAHGDLDGDGMLSTFRVRGSMGQGQLPVLEPLEIDREVE